MFSISIGNLSFLAEPAYWQAGDVKHPKSRSFAALKMT